MVPMSFWVTTHLQTVCHVAIFSRCVIGFFDYVVSAASPILFWGINAFWVRNFEVGHEGYIVCVRDNP
ncbi:hypothetical protein RSP816_17430 (plasmid) [Ralstonia solanacearum]|nr:hypothetical protein RSP816_17430 [Ralstonia solanacearum]